jgi:hypothetical protein
MIGDYDLEPVRSVYDYPLEALLHVGTDFCWKGFFYQIVVPRLVVLETSGLDSSSIFFTDGSKGGVVASFGVYHSGGPESSFRLIEPNFDSNKDSPSW